MAFTRGWAVTWPALPENRRRKIPATSRAGDNDPVDRIRVPEERPGLGPYAQAPGWDEQPSYPAPRQQGQRPQAPSYRNPFEDIVPWWDDSRPPRRSRRVDPDYFWGPQQIY